MLCFGLAAFMPAKLSGQPVMLGLRAPEHQLSPLPPAMLVLPAGTVLTVEASEILSSDKQQPGDSFTAQLHHPLVVDGWVVARPGQTVVGHIVRAKKAGRVKGTSKLTLQLEEIVLVDGHQAYVETEPVENSGPTSRGRDLAAVAITTGVGAAIGSICGARGAAIGAAAGATAGFAGVLLTRGENIEIGPEKLLTFRLSSPLSVSTDQSQFAFWQVDPNDYAPPDRTLPVPQISRSASVISQPIPIRVPLSVWPQIQGIAVGRLGHSECGS